MVVIQPAYIIAQPVIVTYILLPTTVAQTVAQFPSMRISNGQTFIPLHLLTYVLREVLLRRRFRTLELDLWRSKRRRKPSAQQQSVDGVCGTNHWNCSAGSDTANVDNGGNIIPGLAAGSTTAAAHPAVRKDADVPVPSVTDLLLVPIVLFLQL